MQLTKSVLSPPIARTVFITFQTLYPRICWNFVLIWSDHPIRGVLKAHRTPLVVPRHLAATVSDREVQRGLIVYLACLGGSGPKLESRNSPENN